MTVKLNGKTHGAKELDPLQPIHRALVAEPQTPQLVVAVIRTETITEDVGYGFRSPNTVISHIEAVIDPEDKNAVLEVLARARANRTGEATLDVDFGFEADGGRS